MRKRRGTHTLSMDSLRLMSHVCDYNIPLLSCLSFDHSAALARLIKSKEERSSEALEPISLKPFIHCMDGRTESFFILPPSPCTLFHLGLRVLGPKASPPLHAHVFSTDRPSLLADDREEECIHCPRLRQLGKLTSEHGRGRRERDMRMRCTKQSRAEGTREAVYYSALASRTLSLSLSLSHSTIDLSLHHSSSSVSFFPFGEQGKN